MLTDNISQTTEDLLAQAFPVVLDFSPPVAPPEVAGAGGRTEAPSIADDGLVVATPSSLCGQIALFARTQYAMYVGFQVLVLLLAAATACALVYFIYRATNDVDVLASVVVLGGICSGVAAGVLQKLASDARTRYNEAMATWAGSSCS